MASPMSSHGHKLLLFIFSLAIILQWTMCRSERRIGLKSMVERYERWLAKHRESYADDREKHRRCATYQKNVAYIEAFNAVPGRTYCLSDNEFADTTSSEYRAQKNYHKKTAHKNYYKKTLKNFLLLNLSQKL